MRYSYIKNGMAGSITEKTHPAKIKRLVDEGAIFTPSLPNELIRSAYETVKSQAEQTKIDAEILASIGLINGKIPSGYIAVHPDGPAEEYFPGMYREACAIYVENRKVFAKMIDNEGYGEIKQIISVIPQPVSDRERALNARRDPETIMY